MSDDWIGDVTLGGHEDMDSFNDVIVIDKPGDKTVRPITEQHRKWLEKRGLIPPRKPEPPAPGSKD